jgi:hypothetical protein
MVPGGDRVAQDVVHPLIEKARRSKVPVAELIGFSVDDAAGDARQRGQLSGSHHRN